MINITSLAGEGWNYEFRELSNLEQKAEINRPGMIGYAERTQPMFSNLANRWSTDLHSEWVQRQYIALKLIMGATLQFGSADHASKQNLQMAVPYLTYYGMFNAVRASLLLSPRLGWGKSSLTIRHEKAFEKYVTEIELLLSPGEVRSSVDLFVNAKRGRELVSYRFPSSGAPWHGGYFVCPEAAEKLARIAAEIALFNSFCLATAIKNRFGPKEEWSGFEVNARQHAKLWKHVLKGSLGGDDFVHVDRHDMHRVKKMNDLIRRPIPFIRMIGKDGIADFFETFGSPDVDETGFNPAEHRNRLLELF